MTLHNELKEFIVNRVREAVPAEAIYRYGPGVEGPEAPDRHRLHSLVHRVLLKGERLFG
ncbi:hypothetical protein [Alkalilimnicola ehrlichii]|uniref:hypothetical protein n=1 Tax=Alkalilimnicola ehrlichii TaxID=351052 RepID=UPI003BA0EC9E